VREYAVRTYFPLGNRYKEFLANEAEKAKALAQWKEKVHKSWQDVYIETIDSGQADKLQVGNDMRVRAKVHLGALSPEDVSVQIFHGKIDSQSNISDGEIIQMTASECVDGTCLFSGAIRYFKSGRHGFTVRVLPHHDDLSSPFETGQVIWAKPGQR
jgi:starch phosphorylase